jgi:hypothetical protein
LALIIGSALSFMNEEELKHIQAVCHEWLREAGTADGTRLTIQAGDALTRTVNLEIHSLLTFDNVLIRSAVDSETGACYVKLIRQADGLEEIFDSSWEKIASVMVNPSGPASGALPAPGERYQKLRDRLAQAKQGHQGVSFHPGASHEWIEKAGSDATEQPKYLLYTDGHTGGNLLGYSLLERAGPAGQLSGRFHPSEDYFEYAHIFAELPEAENEWMEVNAREAYGIATDESDSSRTRFHDLSVQVAALNLYLASETERRIEAAEIRLEDLSSYYNDQSERWLHVVVAAKPK